MIGKCEICSKEYYIRPSHWKRVRRHFCGNSCKGIGLSGINNPAWKDNWIKKCENCGKEYRHLDSHGKKFCSRKCMGEFDNKNNSVNLICDFCGKEINIKKCLLGYRHFCGVGCFSKFHSKRMSMRGNSNWKGGISFDKYSCEFNKNLKNEIRQRDNYICCECGIDEKQLGENLSIHHIDYNKKNNNKDNLIALCRKCHSYTNFERESWKQRLLNLLRESGLARI